ncbi:pyridoxal-phosphate dependent enzyme [Roseibium sp.]|uniref:pyridoxal-phosphate dependent enzyme n=1 Tax=Roseibium sp. TaxID=1936156 RepID=UPI0035114D18
MLKTLKNPFLGKGLPEQSGLADGSVSQDVTGAENLFRKCPRADETPLLIANDLAAGLAIGNLALKDERQRMGLGSFKALGAAYAIAKLADSRVQGGLAQSHASALTGRTFVCASAGNHGMSLAAGAPLFGARAVVFVAETVPSAFEARLKARGADVVRAGATYEDSMTAAQRRAEAEGWTLLPDSTWPGMTAAGHDVMEGYLVMAAEIARQIKTPPTHVFLQAGVGGLAAACAVGARLTWGHDVTIVVVEPEYAPALMASIEAGKPVTAPGPVSNMGRLDCKEPSHLALKYLAREADFFVTVSDSEAAETVDWLGNNGIATTPSGAGGITAVRHAGGGASTLGLGPEARVLCYLSEGPEDV